ncbi:MAG TPA: hypothetical protein VLL98_04595 [Rickettsiales bacterium]|nr:hypothetical protein [Rickettsiales bacterium]
MHIEEKKQIEIAKKKDNRKVKKLFYSIIFYSSILIICLILFLGIVLFYSQRKEFLQQRITILKKQNSNISLQINNIINKSIAAKNYIKIWNEQFSKEQKELKGIDTSVAYGKIMQIAKDSKLIEVSMNFSPLILTGGIFEKQNIKVFTTFVTIKFNSITDIDVLNFLDNLKKDLNYFIIIQEINLKRTNRINDDFIKTLNNGNIVTAVEGEIKIRLYGLEAK